MESDTKHVNQSHPSLAQYAAKESFWALLSSMEDIATATGECVCVPVFWIRYSSSSH